MAVQLLELSDRWHSLAIHLLRAIRERDHVSGLGPARLSALSVVVYAGPLSLAQLAAAEGVSAPTMSRLVAALVDAGLVQRTADPSDRRALLLTATRRGVQRLSSARQQRLQRLARLLAAANPQECTLLSQAVVVLERLIAGPAT